MQEAIKKELGLVEYTQPSDIKRNYPPLLVIECVNPNHANYGKLLPIKSKDTADLVYRYRNVDRLVFEIPKALNVATVDELKFWIPTKAKIYDNLKAIINDRGLLINRPGNPTGNRPNGGRSVNISGHRDIWNTPCVGVCSTTNICDDICRGCGRTAKEVIEWNGYSMEQRADINRRVLASKDTA